MMGRLSTHILDTANGIPAANVDIRLYALGDERLLKASISSNEDGRAPGPLLEGDAMQAGVYELEFDTGAYFKARGIDTGQPTFLDTVVFCFLVSPDQK
jgi:5-hydroxyisourate hydrolase